jgi:SAM-dependent methyltransferase
MWDQRYATDEYVYGTKPNDFLLTAVAGLPPQRVLCLAEGEGRNAVYLASLGHEVLAVDASAVGLAKAQRLAAERGVQIVTEVADLATYAIAPDSFDLIVSIFCHLVPPVRQRLYRQAVLGLRPGGRFILEAYTLQQIGRGTGGPQVPELLYDLATLRSDLAGLRLIHAQELERALHEGRLHDGVGAVVQVVGLRPESV